VSADEPLLLRVVLLRPGAQLPRRQTAGASGFDLHACLPDGDLLIGPDPMRVPNGIAIEAPAGSDVQIRPRSGLSAQGVMGVFGTLDADYRVELFATLYTVGGREPHRVRHGDRVGQLVVARLAQVEWLQVDVLSETARGMGGHGSTGR
jgi:dUTP pyrophosphatase